MSEIRKKLERRAKIRKGIRSRVFGTPEKPRLSVFRSNKDKGIKFVGEVLRRKAGKTASK